MKRTSSKKPAFELDARYEALFLLLGELRCASIAQLHELFFATAFLHDGAGSFGATTGVPASSRGVAPEEPPRRGISQRSTYNRIATLTKHGYLASYAITGTAHVVVHLTEKGRVAFPRTRSVLSHTTRKPPTDDIAAWAWTRSAMWAAFVADGFTVSRDLRALKALRRNLVDRQKLVVDSAVGSARVEAERTLAELRASPLLSPLTFIRCASCRKRGRVGVGSSKSPCPSCGGKLEHVVVERPHECSVCGYVGAEPEPHKAPHKGTPAPGKQCVGVMKERPYLSFDVAWKKVGASFEVILVVVDNPNRSIHGQLEDLPLRFLGQPRLALVVRPSDDDSIYDPTTSSEGGGTWAAIGPRYRQLLRALSPHENPRSFPYWQSAEVITYRPELVFRTLKRRTRHAS